MPDTVPSRGFCVMHLNIARHPLGTETVRLPAAEAWEEADRLAAEQAVAWWDHNPVFATREEAEEYAWLAPVETEIVAVHISPVPMSEADGWFDSFRSPWWFRVAEE